VVTHTLNFTAEVMKRLAGVADLPVKIKPLSNAQEKRYGAAIGSLKRSALGRDPKDFCAALAIAIHHCECARVFDWQELDLRKRVAGVVTGGPCSATLLGGDDLQSMLRMPNGIHTITHAVFRNENRWNVDSIAFTVPQVRRTDQSGARWLSGDLVMLNNPQPRFVCPELRSIFAPPHE
jgi:hypothetical protein